MAEICWPLADIDVAGHNGAIGPVLKLDAVGGDIDRRIAVMALERGDRLAEQRRRRCREQREAG